MIKAFRRAPERAVRGQDPKSIALYISRGRATSGAVKGDATLQAVVEGEESEAPEYGLLRGQEGNLMKCR